MSIDVDLGGARRERVLPADDPRVRALARVGGAVQRHRIYPAMSPLCRSSLEECVTALAGLGSRKGPATPGAAESSADLRLLVAPDRLYLEGGVVPGSAAIDELADRLFRADVEEVTIQVDAPEAELSRFIRQLARWDRSRSLYPSFAEALAEQGIHRIRVRSSDRLSVLEFDVLSAAELQVLHGEKRKREEGAGDAGVHATIHKAWLRVEMDCPTEPIDMVDLAFLVGNQTDLSEILVGMAGEEPESIGTSLALRKTVSELVHLYAELSEEAAEARFGELARTLMSLEPEARRTITRDVLLPDLIESGKAARLLRLMPDREIVEALRILKDLEMGAPGLMGLALDRLHLPPDRFEALARTVTDDLLDAGGGVPSTDVEDTASAQVRLAADASVRRDLREFTAHDLSVDARTAAELSRIRASVAVLDEVGERLRCVLGLLPHVRNPDRALEVVESTGSLLASLLRERPLAAVPHIRALRNLSEIDARVDPEVAEAVERTLHGLLDPGVVRWLSSEGRDANGAKLPTRELLVAFGPIAASAFLETLEAEDDRAARHVILDCMCEHAALLADGALAFLSDPRWTCVRNAIRVLGFAGPGSEAELAGALAHSDDRVVREAFLALGRVGTPRASEEILARLDAGDAKRRELAYDAIRRFPAAQGARLARRLLSRRELWADRPHVARALIERFLRGGDPEDARYLRPLLGLRFRFWRPQLMRLGWTARGALRGEGA